MIERPRHAKSGRPGKDAQPIHCHDRIRASLVPNPDTIASEHRRAGRFILATNLLNANELSNDELLREYKAQPSTERGFRFLQDSLFFTSARLP